MGWELRDEDVGNIVELGHLNIRVESQRIATLFYVVALGLTRDPYRQVGAENMWVNVGRSQFHLPTGPSQRLHGTIGLEMPDLDRAERRLAAAAGVLAGTQFAFVRPDTNTLNVTCPWGNSFRLHARDETGMAEPALLYVDMPVARGAACGIAGFYRAMLQADVMIDGTVARVRAGPRQHIVFRESEDEIPPFDGHHIEVTLARLSPCYLGLRERMLITQPFAHHQFRFTDLVDVQTGALLYRLEHEVRSMLHPMYALSLVNRPDS